MRRGCVVSSPSSTSALCSGVRAGGPWPGPEARGCVPAAHPGSLFPTPASEEGSESEGSESSGRSCRNERSVQEKLQVLAAEGLLPAVKVFLDWLRANPDLIVVCAQVRLSGAAGERRRGGCRGAPPLGPSRQTLGTCFGWAITLSVGTGLDVTSALQEPVAWAGAQSLRTGKARAACCTLCPWRRAAR